MGGKLLFGITELLIISVFYFLPAVVAKYRDTNNFGVIFAINLLFGWTVLGWIAALIWAILEPSRLKTTVNSWSAPSATPSGVPH